MDSELFLESKTKPTFKITNTGKVLIGLTGGVAIGLSIICAPFVAPALRKYCLPYVPATTQQVENIMSVLGKPVVGNVSPRLLDIGSGDGRIVIAAAKNGLKSDGVELNTWLVQFSRLSALKNGVFNKTKFFQKDLWKFNTSVYDYVIIFGVEQMMKDLETKLLQEVQKDSKIIACRFPFPTIEPNKIIDSGVNTVWVYDMKDVLGTNKRKSDF